MICKYCETDVDVGDTKFAVERTMDMEPPAHVAWWRLDDDGNPNHHRRPLHQCKKGVATSPCPKCGSYQKRIFAFPCLAITPHEWHCS